MATIATNRQVHESKTVEHALRELIGLADRSQIESEGVRIERSGAGATTLHMTVFTSISDSDYVALVDLFEREAVR